jgi:hypothetical protein
MNDLTPDVPPAAKAAARACRAFAIAVALLLPWIAAGCGGGASEAPVVETPASRYDAGPRAGEFPVAERLAIRGDSIFRQKACTACHAFGKPLTGPDLQGVSMRRTARWMEEQILHPEIMLLEDPITIDLYNQTMVRMANQGLTLDEARAVIEYLKRKDEDMAPVQPAAAAGGAAAAKSAPG